MSAAFPRKVTVWSGAVLGGIVTAIKTAESASWPSFSYWTRNHYVLNGCDGRDGIITFAGGHWYPEAPLVGVFHDVHSRRSYSSTLQELEAYFRGCPAYQRSLADQWALDYFHWKLDDGTQYVVTAAFWDHGESIFAADPWELQVANGVDLIENELIEDHGVALAAFEEGSALSPEQAAFARLLFERKLSRPAAAIQLLPKDVKWLRSIFEDPKKRYAELERLRLQGSDQPAAQPQLPWWETIDTAAEASKALKQCRDMFAEIGIYMPSIDDES